MLILSGAEYSALEYDDLLLAIQSADGLHLRIDSEIAPDCLRTLLTLATLSAERKSLRIDLTAVRRAAVLASLHKALLAPLAWTTRAPKSGDINLGAVTPALDLASEEHRYFVAHTSHLRATKPDAFQADLVAHLRRARIILPKTFLASLTTIGFEAHSNAEEYGYRSFNSADEVSFRVIAGVVHEARQGIAPLAAKYFDDYVAAGHSATTRWLELLVVDAGVGLVYPRFTVLASGAQWPNQDVYAGDHATELYLLDMILNKGATTKGSWGRVVNRHTAPGQGMWQIKYRLATSRSCAIVRAGRSVAYWYQPRLTLKSLEIAELPGYEASRDLKTLFRGTAWQILLPLDPQFELGL